LKLGGQHPWKVLYKASFSSFGKVVSEKEEEFLEINQSEIRM
jgi:ureidoglycolate hydrolase